MTVPEVVVKPRGFWIPLVWGENERITAGVWNKRTSQAYQTGQCFAFMYSLWESMSKKTRDSYQGRFFFEHRNKDEPDERLFVHAYLLDSEGRMVDSNGFDGNEAEYTARWESWYPTSRFSTESVTFKEVMNYKKNHLSEWLHRAPKQRTAVSKLLISAFKEYHCK